MKGFSKKGGGSSPKATRRTYKKSPPPTIEPQLKKLGFHKERRRHTLPQDCSTICAGGLNFSVRDGKR
jgi:hypothetical protein